jgi:succinate dehydrogenase/fumarate reductase cytochrome b subunit
LPTRPLRAVAATLTVAVVLSLMTGDSPALAEDGTAQLSTVIDNARLWIVGLLIALGTFFLAVGGVRYLASGGDPGEVEKAKRSFKSAAIGYAIAVLAPILMTALKSIVGG